MRLKTLNGAPLRELLDFSEDALLAPEVLKNHTDIQHVIEQGADSTPSFKWRLVASKKESRLHTGWSQPGLDDASLSLDIMGVTFPTDVYANTSYASSLQTSTILDTTISFDGSQLDSQEYLQHSLIFHDALESSQVLPDSDADSLASSSLMTISFTTTMSGFSSAHQEESSFALPLAPKFTTTPLAALPDARRLRSLYPQTPTPNLLCVLIAAPAEREIVVRRTGQKMKLCEINVADETLSPFRITFWLRAPHKSVLQLDQAHTLLTSVLGRIQVGDVLLLRNVALTSFRDTVYGQSLNSNISRARTSIDILASQVGESTIEKSELPLALRNSIKQVKRWAKAHIAVNTAVPKKRRGTSSRALHVGKRPTLEPQDDEYLPPDTMESV